MAIWEIGDNITRGFRMMARGHSIFTPIWSLEMWCVNENHQAAWSFSNRRSFLVHNLPDIHQVGQRFSGAIQKPTPSPALSIFWHARVTSSKTP